MKKKLISIVGIIILLAIAYFTKDNSVENSNDTQTIENNKPMSEQENDLKTAIGFYNVENLFDIYDDPNTWDEEFTPKGEKKWDRERYNDKLENIVDVILGFNKKNPPSIIGFAEVENEAVLKDLIYTAGLSKFKYKVIHQDNHDGRGIDVAAIYRSDLFEVESTKFHPIILPGKSRSNTRDILEIKGHYFNGEEINVFFNHWSSRRKGTNETEYKRMAASKVLRDKIDIVLDKDRQANIIVMGDFNDEPSNNSLKHIVKSDLINLSKKFEDTKNGTVNHQGDWLVFDQVMISNSFLKSDTYDVSKNDVEIYKNDKMTFTHRDGNETPSRTYGGDKYYGGYSDHYPIFLSFIVKFNQ